MIIKSNTDSSFVGIEKLKEIHYKQITEFKSWASQDKWERFHQSHYDWWVFPINRQSSYGMAWVVYENEVDLLKKDSSFLSNYCIGVELVAAAWGWNVQFKSYNLYPKYGQYWDNWPIRLYKAASSVKLFGYEDLFESLKYFALDLISQGEPFSYNGRDLSWLFTTGIEPY